MIEGKDGNKMWYVERHCDTSKIKREEVKLIIIFFSPLFHFTIKILEFKSINARYAKLLCNENELENTIIGCHHNKYLATMKYSSIRYIA